MHKKERVSIATIAAQLGVAPSTVSRALNGHTTISKALTVKIKKLAAELNYVPDQMAVNLKSGRRNTIGVIVPMIGRNFFASVIEGIEDYAFSRGYDVIICQSKDSELRERRLVNSISGKVDGVIASLSAHEGSHEYFNNLGVPLVLFDRTDSSLNASSVTIDDRAGARVATEHLLDEGFRKIFHFAGPQYVSIWGARHNGYLDAMKSREIEVLDSWVFQAPTTFDEGQKFARHIIESGDIPDAIFCSGDYIALGAMTVFKEHGINMPMVGFANEPICELVEPQLSSVNQFSSKMGEEACRLLLDILSGQPAINTTISPKLIIRKSSLKK